MKTTTHTLRKLKGKQPIVCVTAYDALTARFASEAGVDVILVGDSVGNTLLGFENTETDFENYAQSRAYRPEPLDDLVLWIAPRPRPTEVK